MKKDLATHLSFLLTFFLLIFLFRGWFSLYFLPFWLGGILGMFLPYLDYIVYIYLLKPQEASSLQAAGLIRQKKYKQTFDLLVKTRAQKQGLIFHTAYFQLLFLALAFLVVTSSGSIFGRGLVLAFSLHLLVSQLMDMIETNNLDNWFREIVIIVDRDWRRWYLIGNFIALLILGFVL